MLNTSRTLGTGHAQPRQLDQGGDGVLLLLEGRHRGNHKRIEVLVAALVLLHQVEQFLDVAGPDVHHRAVHGLQEFLQLAKLPATHRMAFAVGRVQALHGNSSAPSIRGSSRCLAMVVLPTFPEKLMTAIFMTGPLR
jgi:hypothetical protein